jgi:hypothetical protein
LLRSIYGASLTPTQHEIFTACTGREQYHGRPFAEATILAGARAGKDSRIACPIASYEALFGSHDRHLARGETGVIPLVAPTQQQTAIAFNYIKSHFESPLLASMLEDEPLSNEIRLSNRMTIECFPCTKSSLRGWSIPAAVLDEVGFYRLEGSADSDAEIQTSVRRGMIAFATSRLVKISTPYMKSGVLFDDFRQHFGADSPDLLCWRAASKFMNPSLRTARLEQEKRLDAQRFTREYLAEFEDDLAAFLPSAWVEAAVVPGRRELPPSPGYAYAAGVDTSGLGSGTNADSFTLAICHLSLDGRVIQDVCRGWKKSRGSHVDLAGIVGEIARLLKAYGLTSCLGDRYGAQWVVEAFAKENVTYQQAEEDKSVFYLATEPVFAQGRIELLDHPQLARELRLLERRPQPGGRTRVDHPRTGHDDYANSLAISAVAALQGFGSGLDGVVFSEQQRAITQESIQTDSPFSGFTTANRRGELW